MAEQGLEGAIGATGATRLARDKAEAVSDILRPTFRTFAGDSVNAARGGSGNRYPMPCPISTDAGPNSNGRRSRKDHRQADGDRRRDRARHLHSRAEPGRPSRRTVVAPVRLPPGGDGREPRAPKPAADHRAAAPPKILARSTLTRLWQLCHILSVKCFGSARPPLSGRLNIVSLLSPCGEAAARFVDKSGKVHS